ncbi:hypothetical protein WY02_03570 [Pseudonocardia sp. AL041005-10]|nr:hypothetical protein [Pseudonocardia sp. AL041005-10]ALE77681.1 hypothetical protein WY02_03570 [Pseudonocardia sp. AL041005-10]
MLLAPSDEHDPARDVGLAGVVEAYGQAGSVDEAVQQARPDDVSVGVGGRLDRGQQEPVEGAAAVGGGVVVRTDLAGSGDLRERDAALEEPLG